MRAIIDFDSSIQKTFLLIHCDPIKHQFQKNQKYRHRKYFGCQNMFNKPQDGLYNKCVQNDSQFRPLHVNITNIVMFTKIQVRIIFEKFL